MTIKIIHADIFSVACDAYVNPADTGLSGSGGLDKVFHQKGGHSFRCECALNRSKMKPGGTVITIGGDLPVKYVLHTASYKCSEETGDGYDLLRKCYTDMLYMANNKPDITHIALPLVGTGAAGYSLQSPHYADSLYSLTAVTILETLLRFRSSSLHTVTIVCSSKEKYEIMQKTFQWIIGKGISSRSRIRGSLLGGAIGDALGYPVEFDDAAHACIREYVLDHRTGKALISDDTQMTLFTACGLLWGYSRSCMKGIGAEPWHYIAFAYEDWLKTQLPDYKKKKFTVSWIRNIPELNARRAPGMTCLSALEAGGGNIHSPLNHSKGCGGVMRIAPLPLYFGAHRRADQVYIARCCAETAAITHGHPLGWLSAAALGNILYDIMLNFSMWYAVEDTILLLEKVYGNYPDTKVLIQLLRQARDLADLSSQTSSINLMLEYNITGRLGEGWVGEEALAVGLFCALAGTARGLDQCLFNAVGHEGDSDSTGSIAGQIWGAYFGEEAIPAKWLKDLELRDVIIEIADDLINDCKMSEYSAYHDADWVRKYLSGENSTHISQNGPYRPDCVVQIPWSEESQHSTSVVRHDLKGNYLGTYDIVINGSTIYHVSASKEAVKTGSPGFGIVTLKYNEETGAYTEDHGWIRSHEGGTVTGYYNNTPFTLLPNHAAKCVEIFSPVSPNPWVGTIRRNFKQWGNPIEVTYTTHSPALSVPLLSVILLNKKFLRGFFE